MNDCDLTYNERLDKINQLRKEIAEMRGISIIAAKRLDVIGDLKEENQKLKKHICDVCNHNHGDSKKTESSCHILKVNNLCKLVMIKEKKSHLLDSIDKAMEEGVQLPIVHQEFKNPLFNPKHDKENK